MNPKPKTFILLALLLAGIGINRARAQTLIPGTLNASGTNYSGANITVTYVVGEIAVQTISTTANFLTQGMLQPEPIVVSGIDEIETMLNLSVFPNPFADKLWLLSSDKPVQRVAIFAMTGQKVYDNMYTGNAIAVEFLPPGMYILFAYDINENLSSFKLIKN